MAGGFSVHLHNPVLAFETPKSLLHACASVHPLVHCSESQNSTRAIPGEHAKGRTVQTASMYTPK